MKCVEKFHGNQKWSGRQESNLRRAVWKTAILPLNYARDFSPTAAVKG